MSIKFVTTTALVTITAIGLGIIANGKIAPHANAEAQTTPIVQTSKTLISNGTFSGRTDHITEGQAHLVKEGDHYLIILQKDFRLDGAPDPVVGFGRNGEYVPSSQIANLKNKRGYQAYKLPADFNPANFDEVYIWCEKFSVPLGVAKLT